MIIKQKISKLLLGLGIVFGIAVCHASPAPFNPTPYEKTILKTAPTLNPIVLNDALLAYQNAKRDGIFISHPYVTIIDYSLPSSAKRLWLIDLDQRRCLMNLLVTHGTKSGDLYAHHFSDRINSHKSSLGLYLTANSYDGMEGYSLVLDGLEPGFNAHALERLIVLHSAPYATQQTVQKYGQLGHSWGCPVVSPEYVHALIDTIKGGSLLFMYYPNSYWLQHSRFLHA